MARPSSDTLTEREAQIMEILWSHGDATAEQIRELLPDRPHDSTVRTLLRILESKGYVAREGPGRPLVYKAEVSRSKAQRTALQRLLGRLFRGSPEALALRLLEDRHLTPEQFEEIARNASIPSPEPRPHPPSSGRKPAGAPHGRPRQRSPEMIADWFDASYSGNPMSALPVVAIVNLTILLLLACAAHAILGRRRVLIRSGLWNAVLLASILQPVVMLGLPRLRIACLPSREVSAVMAETPTLPGFNEPTDHHSRDVAGLPGMPVVTSAYHSDPVRPDSRRLGEDQSRGMSAPSALMGIYAAGVVILSLRLIRSLVAVAELKRMALAVAESSWLGPLAYWRDRLRIARPVSLVWSGRVRIPMLLGWLRPAIVLPIPQDDSAPPLRSHVDAILLHELAHLSRGDDCWNLLQQVVQIMYWPHPLTWLASRLISEVREQACDDLCVHWAGGAPSLSGGLDRRRGGPRPGPAPLDFDRAGAGDGPCLVLGPAPSPLVDRADPRRIGVPACAGRDESGSAWSYSAWPSCSRLLN